jgi:carboxylesterase
VNAIVDRRPLPRDKEVSALALRRPFYLTGLAGHGENAGTGILVVHGFTGTPFEMRFLGESLAARGYTVYGPLLAGHASTAAALGATTWPDWLASVDAAFELLRRETDRVYVCGLSLGALLTLDLARRRGGEIIGISALAVPLWLTRPIEVLMAVTRRLGRRPTFTLPKWAGCDVADPEMRHRNNLAQGTVGLPISAVMSLHDFIAYARRGLGEMHVPALLAHAPQDHVAPYACMSTLQRELGTRSIETHDAPRSHHVITIDYDRDAIAEAVARHVVKTAAPA